MIFKITQVIFRKNFQFSDKATWFTHWTPKLLQSVSASCVTAGICCDSPTFFREHPATENCDVSYAQNDRSWNNKLQ